MKKQAILLFLFSFVFGLVPTVADEVSPYDIDFNNVENTGSSTFEQGWVPASGWSHVVKTNYSGTPFSYYGNTSQGVDGSACIKTGGFMDSNWDYYNPGDALITPLVSGNITLQVRSDSYQAGVALYKYTLNGGEWVQGSQLLNMDMSSGLVRNEYVEVSCSLDEAAYVGIVAYQCYLDNFHADKADIVKQAMVKMNVTAQPQNDYVDADADGNFSVSFSMTMKNIGDLDIEDETKTVKLVNANDESIVYDTKSMPMLFVGEESEEMTFTANIQTTDYAAVPFRFVEDLAGGSVDLKTITPIVYAPVVTMQSQSGYNYVDVNEESTINFGTTQKSVVKNFRLKNDGGAAYVISSVAVPEGYSTSLAAETSVNAHSSVDFTITKEAGFAGTVAGNLVIEGNGKTFTLPVTGVTVDETAWYVDFEDNKMPNDVNTLDGTWSVNSINYSLALENNSYMCQSPLYTEPGKFISPLLDVEDGAVLNFDAAKLNNDSFLKVYYSADRKNWTLAKTIKATEGDDTDDVFNTESTSGWYTYYYYKTFEVNTIPAGQWFVAFEGGSANIDNIVGYKKAEVEKDFFIQSSKMPSEGEVNKAYTATAIIKNSTNNNVEAGSYAVKLYFDNQLVGETAGVKLKAGETTEQNIAFTPHADGTFNAYIEVEGGDMAYATDAVEVVIGKEQLESDIQVGAPGDRIAIMSSPLSPAYNSEGEVIYTAELLAEYGLKQGDKINKITILGTNGGNYNGASPWEVNDLTITIANSDDNNLYMPAQAKTMDNPQTIHEGAYTYPVVGEYKNYSYTGYGKLIEVAVEGEPFEYTGGSIILHLKNVVDGGSYRYMGFLADNSKSYHSIQRMSYSSAAGLESASYSNNYLPVTLFGIEAVANSLNGKVSDAQGNAVEGAQVTLKSGEVLYSATTDAEGQYTIEILKSKLQYDMKVVKAGFVPYEKNGLSFAEGSLVEDATLAVATGLYINSTDVPAEGEVNKSLKVVANVMNPLAQALDATDYTARLVVDNGDEAVAETVKLESLEETNLSFNYTPHAVGVRKVYVELKNGDNTVVSDEFEININEESLGGYYQVLDSVSLSSGGPISLGSYRYENQTIYTPEQLKFPAGSVIKNLQYRGYVANGYYGNVDTETHVKVWIENTDVPTDLSSDEYTAYEFDTSSREPDYEADVRFVTKGASDSLFVMLDIPVDVQYTGKNLRITMTQQLNEGQSSSSYVYWIVDANVKQNYTRSSYSENQSFGSWNSNSYAPVVFITTDNHANVEGKVTDYQDNPIENAEVKIQSGDVYYTATTDAEGYYNATIAQLQLEYSAVVTAEGYQPAMVETVEVVPAETTTMNVQLHKHTILTGVVTEAETGETVENAHVAIVLGDEEIVSAETDAEGAYAIEADDLAGEYTLVVSAEGYTQSETTIVLDNGEFGQNVQLEVKRNIISGVVSVVDNPGDEPRPIAGATVIVTTPDGEQMIATTNENGEYSIELMRPNGTYTVSFALSGYVADDVQVEINQEDVVVNMTLYSAVAADISELMTKGTTVATVYTLGGQLVGRSVELKSLHRGIYVINGKKYVVK